MDFGLNTAQKSQSFNNVIKENKTVVLTTCGAGLLGVAISVYGVVTVGTYLAEESAEYVFEQMTGIPVILDPIDALEQIVKKGGKQFAREVIVEGRKFIDIKQAQYWAYNVKTFGKDLAEMISQRKITITQAKAFKSLDNNRDAFKSFENMTESELSAFNHAISRHGEEFGLKWGKKELYLI